MLLSLYNLILGLKMLKISKLKFHEKKELNQTWEFFFDLNILLYSCMEEWWS